MEATDLERHADVQVVITVGVVEKEPRPGQSTDSTDYSCGHMSVELHRSQCVVKFISDYDFRDNETDFIPDKIAQPGEHGVFTILVASFATCADLWRDIRAVSFFSLENSDTVVIPVTN